MHLIPAIDLKDGRVVRLYQGDYARQTRYDSDPVSLARDYAAAGARHLHVVDLDGARDGGAPNLAVLAAICEAAPLQVQAGGGVRTRDDIARRLDAGAARVVVGSLCACEPARFTRWMHAFGGDTLVAGLDVSRAPDGRLIPRIRGWTRAAEMDLFSLLEHLVPAGLQHLLCTDIARDGALSGPGLYLYREILAAFPDLRLQASGGVAHSDHLAELAEAGAAACIVGRALLEGQIPITTIGRWNED